MAVCLNIFLPWFVFASLYAILSFRFICSSTLVMYVVNITVCLNLLLYVLHREDWSLHFLSHVFSFLIVKFKLMIFFFFQFPLSAPRCRMVVRWTGPSPGRDRRRPGLPGQEAAGEGSFMVFHLLISKRWILSGLFWSLMVLVPYLL